MDFFDVNVSGLCAAEPSNRWVSNSPEPAKQPVVLLEKDFSAEANVTYWREIVGRNNSRSEYKTEEMK